MLVPDPETPEGERVKIFDFGIAKLRVDSLGPTRGQGLEFRTATGIIMGTPTHMAPEQCRGVSDITGKADVYALGIILYQCLIGHPPFMASSAGELLSMHLRDQPAPLRKLDKFIAEDIADFVHRMIAKEPNDRPEMSEVVAGLEELGAQRSRGTLTSDAVVAVTRGDKGRQKVVQTLAPVVGQTIGTVTQRRFAVAILIACGLVLIAAVLLFGDYDKLSRSTSASDTSGTAQVRWIIDSEPSGAQVIRDDNGQVLGTTRYDADWPRSNSEFKLRVRADGYSDQTVIANANSNLETTVHLNKLPAAPPPRVDRTPTPSPNAPTATVEWKIASRPSSTVIRAEDGKVLGVTPFTLSYPAGTGTIKVLLRAPGYADQSVILDQREGTDMKFVLKSTRPRNKRAVREDEIPLFDSPEGGSTSTSEPPK